MPIPALLMAMIAMLFIASTDVQFAQSPVGAASVVLVQGALTNGSSRRGVYDILIRDGNRVTTCTNRGRGPTRTGPRPSRVIDQQDGAVVRVGHSCESSIITVADIDPKVKALV